MFYGDYNLILKFSILSVILAQGFSTPVPEDGRNSTRKAAEPVQEIPSPAAVHESIKKDIPELKGDTEALVEAPVEVVGPRAVDSEGQGKVQKKRESKDNVDETEEADEKQCSSAKDDDEAKEDLAEDPDSELKDDVGDTSSKHSRQEDEGDNDYEDVEDAEENNDEVRQDVENKSEVDDEEDQAEHYDAHEVNSDDNEDRHHNPKREGRPNRQGPKIWDQWGKWSSCSVTCGVGKLTRWRHCVAGGCSPGEKEAQLKTCTFAAC